MTKVSPMIASAHVADQLVHLVQHPEDRLGQEEEPAPVDRVDKAGIGFSSW